MDVYTLEFLIYDSWAGRESLIFGVWAASASPKTIPEGGGRSPPPSGMVFGAAGAAQTPQIGDFRPAEKSCIKSPCVLTAAKFVSYAWILEPRTPIEAQAVAEGFTLDPSRGRTRGPRVPRCICMPGPKKRIYIIILITYSERR
jgi:hypothetical protein